MSWFLPNDAQYAHMDRRPVASTQAHTHAQGRLMQHEMEIRGHLHNLELDFHPIRFVSNQSNVKGQIIKKQNYCLGWIAQDDTYVMLQNTTCPSESEVLRHISYKPGCNLSNLPLSVFNLIHYADKIGATDEILLQMYLKKH